jgi:hypothetical protein
MLIPGGAAVAGLNGCISTSGCVRELVRGGALATGPASCFRLNLLMLTWPMD